MPSSDPATVLAPIGPRSGPGTGPVPRPSPAPVPGPDAGRQANADAGPPPPAVTGGAGGPTTETGVGGVDAIISGLARQIGSTVKPEAAAAVASTFGFPLVLMVAVLLFLLGQSRLDGRDPKLRAAPLTVADTVLPFRDEEAL
jgi:hypothetical protein